MIGGKVVSILELIGVEHTPRAYDVTDLEKEAHKYARDVDYKQTLSVEFAQTVNKTLDDIVSQYRYNLMHEVITIL
jgi:hypothetical protein